MRILFFDYCGFFFLLKSSTAYPFCSIISDHKEYTIPVSSIVQLECDDGLKIINDINVTVRRSNTTCLTTSDECTLPNNAIESIEDKCNKHSSCKVDIHDEITNHWCLQDYGYVNFSYACKSKFTTKCQKRVYDT